MTRESVLCILCRLKSATSVEHKNYFSLTNISGFYHNIAKQTHLKLFNLFRNFSENMS